MKQKLPTQWQQQSSENEGYESGLISRHQKELLFAILYQ